MAKQPIAEDTFAAYAKGDRKAGERIARAYMPLASAIAREYLRFGLAEDELCAEAYSGIFHAMGKFTPGRGVRFSTYASYWVRAYVITYILKTLAPASGSPAYSSKHFFRLRREYAQCLQAACGDDGAAREMVMSNLGINAGRYAEMQEPLRAPLAEDFLDESDEHGSGYKHVIPDPGPSPEEQLLEKERQAGIKAAARELLAQLPERERAIVMGKLMADPPLTFAEIGLKLGLSRERTRQIFDITMQKLRATY